MERNRIPIFSICWKPHLSLYKFIYLGYFFLYLASEGERVLSSMKTRASNNFVGIVFGDSFGYEEKGKAHFCFDLETSWLVAWAMHMFCGPCFRRRIQRKGYLLSSSKERKFHSWIITTVNISSSVFLLGKPRVTNTRNWKDPVCVCTHRFPCEGEKKNIEHFLKKMLAHSWSMFSSLKPRIWW